MAFAFSLPSNLAAERGDSPNSDYDVRLIYAPEPQWYQAVDLEERHVPQQARVVDQAHRIVRSAYAWTSPKTIRKVEQNR